MRAWLSLCALMILSQMVLLSVSISASEQSAAYLPSSAPISMRPTDEDEFRIGYGYNTLTLTRDWKEDLMTTVEEDIGEIQYDVRNFVIGMMKAKKKRATLELDILVGTVESKSLDDSYYSPSIGKTINVRHSGDGYDYGLRAISSIRFFQQTSSTGAPLIDWNVAFSLHVSRYSLDNEYRAASTDEMERQIYTEELTGFFIRPAVALQPNIHAGDRIIITPFLGLETKIYYYKSDWVTKEDVWNGRSLFDYHAPEWQGSGVDEGVEVGDIQTSLGFDVGVIINKAAGHEIDVGGVIGKILGGASDFQEVHALYNMPF